MITQTGRSGCSSFIANITALAVFLVAVSAAHAETIVAVFTGDRAGAGTNADVYLTLQGDKSHKISKSYLISDEAPGRNLERAYVDVFVVKEDLGNAIRNIWVESEGGGAAGPWLLDQIVTLTFDRTGNEVGETALYKSVQRIEELAKDGLFGGPQKTEMSEANFEAFKAAHLKTLGKNGIVVSTFPYNEIIVGGDDPLEAAKTATSDDQVSRRGIKLSRYEPAAKEIDSPAKSPRAAFYLVYMADALDSQSVETNNWKETISEEDTLVVTNTNSSRQQAGFDFTAFWNNGDGSKGPQYGAEISLNAELEWLQEESVETSSTKTTATEQDTSFEAQPGTMQIKIQKATAVLTEQWYESTLGNGKFRSIALKELSESRPQPYGATFKSGIVGDGAWNRTVAEPAAFAFGKSGYDELVVRLKKFGCLVSPMTFEQASAALRGESQATEKVAPAPVAVKTVKGMKFTITKLVCKDITEARHDEIYLKVAADGKGLRIPSRPSGGDTTHHVMKESEGENTWILNKSFDIKNSITVSAFEDDGKDSTPDDPNQDDLVGKETINQSFSESGGNSYLTFNGDDGIYRVYYKLEYRY